MRYVVKRLLQTIPILIGISIIIFALVNLQPGDPYANMMDPNLSAEMREEMLEKIGYYDPLPVQYVRWLGRAVQGDLGYSVVYKAPVLEVKYSDCHSYWHYNRYSPEEINRLRCYSHCPYGTFYTCFFLWDAHD